MKTKPTYRPAALLVLASLLALATVCSCERIRDDRDDCGVYLEFIYDMNMEYTNAFAVQVPHVDLYFFDAGKTFLFRRHVEVSDLTGNMFIGGNDIPFGRYTILAVGGVSDNFRAGSPKEIPLVPGESRLEDFAIGLVCEGNKVSQDIAPMWMAPPIEINYRADLSVHRIRFVKDTNRFNLLFVDYDSSSLRGSVRMTERVGEDAPPYTFIISTTDGGIYNSDNQPVTSGPMLFYTPYLLEAGTAPEELAHGKISTARLIDSNEQKYVLTVADTRNGNVVWQHDLIDLLRYLKPDTRLDGTPLPMQEFLDRQSEWNLVLIFKESQNTGRVVFGIVVAGWIIWFNDIEV